MGMITTYMKRTSILKGETVEETPEALLARISKLVHQNARDNHNEGCAMPEHIWDAQENLKRTPEIKAKYLDYCQRGRVVVAEIDE